MNPLNQQNWIQTFTICSTISNYSSYVTNNIRIFINRFSNWSNTNSGCRWLFNISNCKFLMHSLYTCRELWHIFFVSAEWLIEWVIEWFTVIVYELCVFHHIHFSNSEFLRLNSVILFGIIKIWIRIESRIFFLFLFYLKQRLS